ncbi:MAG: WD40 repeat domain-containing protein [Syntrophales bacterium]
MGAHTHQYHGVAVSPDGSRMITANRDHTARLWDIASGQCLMVFEGHTGELRRTAFMNDGVRAVTTADDGTLRLWDCATGACILVLKGHTGRVIALAVSPDERYIVSSGDEGAVRVWSLPSGRCEHIEERAGRYVTKVLITGDGDTLFTLDSRHDLNRWSFPHIGNPCWINRLVFRDYEDFAVTGDEALAASRWSGLDKFNTRNGNYKRNYSFDPLHPYLVTLTPDGTRFLACCAYTNVILVVNYETGAVEKELAGHGKAVTGMALSPDGNTLCTVSLDLTCRIWDVSRGECLRTIRPARTVRRLFFLSDGKSLGTFDSGGAAKTWNLVDGSHRTVMRDVSSVAVLSLPGLVATGHRDGGIRLWEVENRKEEPGAVIKAHREPVNCLVPVRSGASLVTCAFDGVKLWDVERRDCIKTLSLQRMVAILAVDDDREWIATGFLRENDIHIYDLRSGDGLAVLTGHTWPATFANPLALRGLHFLSRGKGLVSCGRDGRVILWDLSTFRAAQSIEKAGCDILSMAVEGDGRHVIVGTINEGVQRWSFESGQQEVLWPGKGHAALSVALSPDERRVFASLTDGTVRIIDRESGTLLCTLWNVDNGFLWSVPPDEHAPEGWVWTDRDDLLHVVEESGEAKILGAVPLNDDRRRTYIHTRNNAAMVRARLQGRDEYNRTAGRYACALAKEQRKPISLPRPLLPEGDGHA